MPDKRNARRGGFYWVGDTPYASVTQILTVLNKPALSYWYGKEVFYAMVKNPGLNEKDALAAPYQKGNTAKDRGKTVHSFIEAFKRGADVEKMLASLPPQFKGYGQAFCKWVSDYDVTFLEREKTVFSHQHKYGGTADMLCLFGDSPHVWVVDGKTGKSLYPEVELQLSAYKQAFKEEGIKVDALGGLLLEIGSDDKPTGNYVFHEKNDSLEPFLALKTVWEWSNQSKISRLGYVS